MSRPPYPSYPHHHPHYGRPYIQVHDHDVLSGRGVNIAQHPGNERFRSLVNTRQDESYCANFTTSEKRALAEEIIHHIQSLNPPGRFLKRSGRSQCSRGLNGPWEELSHRECIKKTCQALRDCNRQDRQGYAAQVTAPTDVKHSAQERAKTGLTLKEYAAAAVAKASPAAVSSSPYNLSPRMIDRSYSSIDQRKRNNDGTTDPYDRLSPSVEHAAHWLKKQKTENAPAPFSGHDTSHAAPSPCDPVLSAAPSQVQATPAPWAAPVPVTATPSHSLSHHHSNGHLDNSCYHQEDPTMAHLTSSPLVPSPTSYHLHHPDAVAPAPYSPVVLLHDDNDDDPNHDMDGHHSLDEYTSDHHHTQQFDDHASHSFHSEHEDEHAGPQPNDVLQSAAAAAALLDDHHHHHLRNNSLSLIPPDDALEHL